jgi:hypothetical protein
MSFKKTYGEVVVVSWGCSGKTRQGREKELTVVLRTWLASVLAPSMTALTFLNICSCGYVVTSRFNFGIKVHPEELDAHSLGLDSTLDDLHGFGDEGDRSRGVNDLASHMSPSAR